MINGILEVLLGIVGLSIVVLVHEGGHYIAARFTGIRVETFSIGFGRRLIGFSSGETDYRISLVPLGGYCRFYGEQSFREALDEKLNHIPGEKGEFYGSSPLKRIIVSFSGPLANLVFAVVVFTMISWIGYQDYYTEPRVILLSDWSEEAEIWPSDIAGLESGDYIRSLAGRDVDRYQQLRRFLIFRPGDSLPLIAVRDGRDVHLTITPELNRESGVALIGVLNWVNPVVGNLESGGSAKSTGLQTGDRIVSINGNATPHTVALFRYLEEIGNQSFEFEVFRNGSTVTLQADNTEQMTGGLSFKLIAARSEKLNGFQALSRGFREAYDTFSSTLKGLRMLFMGIKVQNAVSGPIRLISDTGAVVAEGFRSSFGQGLLWSFELMSLISVSLAILNLLPIPVLDGGQILLFTIEIFRRKPLNPRSVYRYQFVGTIIVLAIAIFATTGDLIHLNGR